MKKWHLAALGVGAIALVVVLRRRASSASSSTVPVTAEPGIGDVTPYSAYTVPISTNTIPVGVTRPTSWPIIGIAPEPIPAPPQNPPPEAPSFINVGGFPEPYMNTTPRGWG